MVTARRGWGLGSLAKVGCLPRRIRSSPVKPKQAPRALLLEVECLGRWRLDFADSAAEVGYLGTYSLLGQHPDRERKRHRAHVVPPFDRQAERGGGQIGVGVLPVAAGVGGLVR